MKLFSAIFAVFMFFLSVMPCDDSQGDKSPDLESHLHAQNSQDHEGHSETDDCSPFCVCQCCQTSIIFSINSFESPINFSNTDIKFNFYQSFHPNGMIHAIWHPPKIS